MGITYVEALALRDAVKAGASFRRTATIGRQWLLTRAEGLPQLLTAAGVPREKQAAFLAHPPEWADELFGLLGAEELVSLDASGYEGATVVHDMNEPLPDALAGGFDFVFDGGTLEHVFNFPRAVRNEMELTRVGGHLLISVPANNHLGHGFYQFSPELFYRVLGPDNGFEVVGMTLTEWWSGRRYGAVDPAAVGRRVELYATGPALVVSVLARRTEQKPIFARPPVQSDYATAWTGATVRAKVQPTRLRRWLVGAGERWFPGLLNYVRRRRSRGLRYHPDLFPPRPPEQ
jgi:hypothetical protein